MLRLDIRPSPCAEIVVTRYDDLAFPRFRELFETPPESSPLHHLARDPKEAPFAVVLENRSDKAITGLSYRIVMTDDSGKQHTRTFVNDSYMTDMYRAIVESGSRQLITPSDSLDERMMDHVLLGGGLIQFRASGLSERSLAGVVEMIFEIDFVLFTDGEILGADPDRYVEDLLCRKPAAEFVAKQIRLAINEARDVSPVLSALVDIPRFGRSGDRRGDPLMHWIRHYAREYLHAMGRKIGTIDMHEAKLRHLENRPALPKFHRRPNLSSKVRVSVGAGLRPARVNFKHYRDLARPPAAIRLSVFPRGTAHPHPLDQRQRASIHRPIAFRLFARVCSQTIPPTFPRFPPTPVSYRIIRLFLGAASEATYTAGHAEPKQPVRTPHTRGQR